MPNAGTHRRTVIGSLAAAAAVAIVVWACLHGRRDSLADFAAGVLAEACATPTARAFAVTYPAPGTLFPPDLAPPTFTWRDAESGAARWLVSVGLEGARTEALATVPSWTPRAEQWETIVRLASGRSAALTIIGLGDRTGTRVVSRGEAALAVASDPVAAPIFYREVVLPFIEAVKDPSRIRWRFGTVSSTVPPPIVLENLPVCGNCHSFPRDGSVLAMDVDYYLALALAENGGTEDAAAELAAAVALAPAVDTSPRLHDRLGINLAGAGRYAEAAREAARGALLAHAAGLDALARDIAQRKELYDHGLPCAPGGEQVAEPRP